MLLEFLWTAMAQIRSGVFEQQPFVLSHVVSVAGCGVGTLPSFRQLHAGRGGIFRQNGVRRHAAESWCLSIGLSQHVYCKPPTLYYSIECSDGSQFGVQEVSSTPVGTEQAVKCRRQRAALQTSSRLNTYTAVYKQTERARLSFPLSTAACGSRADAKKYPKWTVWPPKHKSNLH